GGLSSAPESCDLERETEGEQRDGLTFSGYLRLARQAVRRLEALDAPRVRVDDPRPRDAVHRIDAQLLQPIVARRAGRQDLARPIRDERERLLVGELGHA